MSLISNSIPDIRYSLTLYVSGKSANVRLTAYKEIDGEKVLQPDNDQTVIAVDAETDDRPAIQHASAKLSAAVQDFINEMNF